MLTDFIFLFLYLRLVLALGSFMREQRNVEGETGKEERRMLWYNGKSMTLDVRNSIFYSLILTCCIIYKISQSAACCLLSRFSHVLLFATPGTVAHQALLSRGFSSKHTGVGCYFLLQGIFPTQGLNPHFLCLLLWQAGS